MTSKAGDVFRRKKELFAKALLKADEADRVDEIAAQAKAALLNHENAPVVQSHQANASGWEPIIEVAAEGGAIVLRGIKDGKGQWWFCLGRDERTLELFLDGIIDRDLLQGQSEIVAGWEEGMKLLNQYSWHHLCPCLVHREFHKLVLAEITTRQSEMDPCEVKEWQARCSDKKKDNQEFCLVEEKPRRKMEPLVKEHLNRQRPLSVVRLADLYPLARNQKERDSIRAALHRVSVGTTVFENSTPSTSYAIRVSLINGDEVFLSLPGIPTRELRTEKSEKQYTNEIFKRFADKYGPETIRFWVQSAQHRSVVQAARGMRTAKKRDNKACVLCEVEGISDQRTVSACHIVSRKVLFWEALAEVESTQKGIFTDQAILLLRKKLKNSARHSDSDYIVTLCREHDTLVRNTISLSIGRCQLKAKFAPTNTGPTMDLFRNQK